MEFIRVEVWFPKKSNFSVHADLLLFFDNKRASFNDSTVFYIDFHCFLEQYGRIIAFFLLRLTYG